MVDSERLSFDTFRYYWCFLFDVFFFNFLCDFQLFLMIWYLLSSWLYSNEILTSSKIAHKGKGPYTTGGSNGRSCKINLCLELFSYFFFRDAKYCGEPAKMSLIFLIIEKIGICKLYFKAMFRIFYFMYF